MNKQHHVATWFEIPAKDLDRAMKFYGKVLGVKLEASEFGPMKMAVFPVPEGAPEGVVHGALVKGEHHEPSADGTLVYLNGGDDLAGPLSRVAGAGGKVLQPKMSIGPHGFMAIFLDTEGNRLALHSFA